MTYTVHALINNKPGVLAQMVATFAGCGLNIDKMMLDQAEDQVHSRITLTTFGEEQVVGEVMGQLKGLQDVVSLQNDTDEQMSFYVASQINAIYM